MSKQKKVPIGYWCETHEREAKTRFGDGFVCAAAYMGAGPCRVVPRYADASPSPVKRTRPVGAKKKKATR